MAEHRREYSWLARGGGLRAAGCVVLFASLSTVGCTVGPDYKQPDVLMPDAWHQELTRGLDAGEANLQTWWTSLQDPVLDGLIERAAAGNLDLKEAFGRVQEARARRGIATGEWFPDLDAIGSAQRNRISEDFLPPTPDLERNDNFFGVGVDATWEVDVWGRIRRSVESADAALQASTENYRDVLVILYAEVALNYVEVRSLQARIRYAQANVQTQRESLTLTKDRLKAQIAPELDVRQAELNLSRTESIIPTLRILETAAVNRLGVLLGEFPSALRSELQMESPIPNPPALIGVGIPGELLRQRPDLRRAERELAAQHARIGAATADLYPRFSLLGTFALEATQIGDVFDASSSYAFSIGPSVRWNLFDGGRVRNNILAQDALTMQALARYENTVLRAIEEVENAIVGYAQESDRRDALGRSVTAAQESVKLVKTLYRTGLTDFQNVLDMERSLFVQQDEFAASEGAAVQNLIRIYKALGGGWDPDPPVLAEEIADAEKGEPRI